jgi:nucleotide-binding universal stress UspA family protein
MKERMRILIAEDAGGGEEAGVADLKRAGLPERAEVLVLSVADVLLPPSSRAAGAGDEPSRRIPDSVQRAIDDAQRAAARARLRILAAFPQWEVRTGASADSPAWAIIKKAEEWQPALIVVGSHRRSAPSRFMLGSVSHKVLSEARCTVRIARLTTIERDQPSRLLIGFDGSADATAAVEAVAQRSWPARSRVRVIGVVDPILASATPPGSDDPRAALEEKIAAAITPLQRTGIEVSHETPAGDPKRSLVDEANRWGADCIFVGARGLRAIERFPLGGVSAAVAARAHCSVEVVRGGGSPKAKGKSRKAGVAVKLRPR